MQTNDKKKISAVIPTSDFELLKTLADEQNISMTDALRRALKTTDWLRQVKRDKGQIIIRDKDNREREAVLLD